MIRRWVAAPAAILLMATLVITETSAGAAVAAVGLTGTVT